jgi:hypothetical protein
MPLLNFGILPPGAVGNELIASTRRAVMPAVVVQIGKSTVLLSSMLAAAEPLVGGVSPVTLPIQGTRMVSGAWTDYSGSGNAPQVLTGLLNAEFNLAAFVVFIPYYLFEGLVQVDAEIVPIIWARMNDAGNYVADQLALALWAAQSANTNLMPFSINDIISTTNPTQGNVGNIDRSANTFWQANSTTITAINTGGTTFSRVNATAAIQYAQKASSGEPPSCVLLSPGAFAALAADVIGSERYNVMPEGSYADSADGVQVAFPALNIASIPVYQDLYQTVNTVALMPNFNYFNMKIHQDAAFAVAGPESLLPQFQLGYVMALFVLLAVVTSKSNAQSVVTGFTGSYNI